MVDHSLALHFSRQAVRRVRGSVIRAMPLNSMLMPTNVPTAHKELDGQWKKMRAARSREIRLSTRNQTVPRIRGSRANRAISKMPSACDVDGKHQRERDHSGDGQREHVEGGDNIDDSDQDLSENGTHPALGPGIYDMRDAGDQHQAAEEDTRSESWSWASPRHTRCFELLS
jgi:hypothetical protein